MKIGVLPGTFSPPTLGHLDIIKRSASLCQKLIIVILDNPNKCKSPFTLEEKKSLLSIICRPFSNVEIVGYQGLLVDFVQQQRANCVIRGLRSTGDFEYEEQMAMANKALSGMETIFLMTTPAYAHISSSLTREIGQLGRRLHNFVPEEIEEQIYNKLNSIKG